MENKVPSKWAYSGLTALGFLCGILWGVIDAVYLTQMVTALKEGNLETANDRAKKIKTTTLIGLTVNVLLVIIYLVVK